MGAVRPRGLQLVLLNLLLTSFEKLTLDFLKYSIVVVGGYGCEEALHLEFFQPKLLQVGLFYKVKVLDRHGTQVDHELAV